MIERYTRPEFSKIWSDENKYRKWLEVELAVCEAQARLGVIPGEALTEIKSKARFDTHRIAEIERTVNHDVIAFLTNVAENVGPSSRFIHLGMTSNDVLDTSLSLVLREASQELLKGLQHLRSILARRAREFRHTPCIGRTHGIHAEPVTFGLKLALWYDELGRAIQRLERVTNEIAVVKISGAVGTFEHLDPKVEEITATLLHLRPVSATQVVPRDLHADYVGTLAVIAASIERFATEIRNLQRTEILEVEEHFSKGQKGSSAMPHKRNPIRSERVAGMARLVRGYAMTAFENVALWHERDITHSSVERVMLPDATTTLDFMITQFAGIMDDLIVYPDNMRRNIDRTRGLVFSQPVMLALTKKGMLREEAYRIVQECAMEVWQNESLRFRDLISSHESVQRRLTAADIDTCFDLSQSMKNIDYLFHRIGLS